jgi:hypothetical protein
MTRPKINNIEVSTLNNDENPIDVYLLQFASHVPTDGNGSRQRYDK